MNGVYFSATMVGRIWAMQQVSLGQWASSEKLDTPYSISSFGEDEGVNCMWLTWVGKSSGSFPARRPRRGSLADDQAGFYQLGPKWRSLTYTIALRNAGGSFSNTVRLTDTLPPDWST